MYSGAALEGINFSHYLNDPTSMYFVAFVVFVLIAYRLLRKPVGGWLDGEIAKIQEELNIAKNLHSEAEALLKDCKEKEEQAVKEAANILEKARAEVARLKERAELEIEAIIERQEAAAKERIHLSELKAIEEVRASALHMGLELAKKKINKRLSDKETLTLIDNAIDNVPKFRKIV